MILDLYSHEDSLQARIESARRLIASNVPAILMADDSLRSTAFELVRSGAFGYCRRPPSIRDLKTMLSRACETFIAQAAAVQRAAAQSRNPAAATASSDPARACSASTSWCAA